MEKRINKKVLSLILSLVLIMAIFVGRSVSYAPANGSSDLAKFQTVQGTEVMLYDYEEIADFQEINASLGFGLTSMNTDPKYVKSGNGSMHVRVEAYEEFYHFPEKIYEKRQVIVMYPNWFFENKKDYSDALAFKIDVYNVSDRDMKISFCIVTSTTTVVLGPEIAVRNCWNELTFEVDFESAIYRGMDSVKTFAFAFENRVQGQTAAECYIDNFKMIKSATKSQKLNYIPAVNGDMVCDFEDRYFELTAYNGLTSYPNIGVYDWPTISINTDSQFAKSGNKSLKIVRHPSRYNHSLFPEWSDIFPFTAEFIDSVNWKKYDTDKSYIYMDAYNDSDEQVMLRVYCVDGKSQGMLKETYLAPNAWTTVKVPMYHEYMEWANLASFNIMFGDFYGIEDSVIYIDDIRLVESYV